MTGATQVLQGYIEGRQDQLRIQIKRGLKLLLTAEHPEVRNVSKAIRVGDVEVEPLVLELYGPAQSREERQIARILKTGWSRGEAAFEDILEELVASPDPWLDTLRVFASRRFTKNPPVSLRCRHSRRPRDEKWPNSR